MKSKVIIIVTTLVLLINNSFLAQELELTLTSEKSNYVQYEPIYVMIKIKNIDSKPITIPKLGFGYNNLELEVTNNDGMRIAPSEIVEISGQNELKYTLMPGEEIFNYFEILSFGNQYSYKKKITLSGSYFKPGTYKICIKYKFKNSLHEKIIKKAFTSNKQTMIISKNAVEDEQGIIVDLQYVWQNRIRNRKESIKKAIDIVEKYPHHLLVKQAYINLGKSATNYYEFDHKKYMEKFILDFPNTFRAVRIASQILEKDKNFDEKIVGTEFYTKVLGYKKNEETKLNIIKRNPCNKIKRHKNEK